MCIVQYVRAVQDGRNERIECCIVLTTSHLTLTKVKHPASLLSSFPPYLFLNLFSSFPLLFLLLLPRYFTLGDRYKLRLDG